jgi:hypothetical protein
MTIGRTIGTHRDYYNCLLSAPLRYTALQNAITLRLRIDSFAIASPGADSGLYCLRYLMRRAGQACRQESGESWAPN